MPAFQIKDIPAVYRRARQLQAEGQLQEACALYQDIVALRPQTAEAHFEIGRITHSTGDYGTALKALEQARRQRPREPAVLMERAQVLSDWGRIDAAIDAHRELQRVVPGAVGPHVEIGLLEQRAGRQDRAEEAFRAALELKPGDGELYRLRMTAHRTSPGDPLIDEMRALHGSGQTRGASRASLCFALARALEQAGAEPGEVWRYLEEANALTRARAPYDRAAREAEDAAHIAATESFAPGNTAAPDGFRPIFVTGMPRAGTTLVEQMLASHGQVTGGGEMAVTGQVVRRVLSGQLAPQGFAPALETAMRRKLEFGRVVADKSLQTYRHIGPLAALLPDAPVFVVHRDPRDQLFSIFRQVFREGRHRYAYDLGDLVHAFAAYRRMIDHWRERVPGAFVELDYQQFVAAPEAGARRIIGAAGLAWEDGVMEFHKSARDVRTLSAAQVREPVHDRSIGAWKPYAAQLAPMLEALEAEGLLPG
ncbi:tetratricopeptide repeat-containing sulfotransferase family protein [Oceanicola sp. 502str15]|uniref:tetratricopeptide repeat-containing sulfotransferase family protein n=1 Tax=Oceanicola sp. 502str15 TaxID=2696061 RepID=UPI0020941729|nr:tetratricopeptide repeat-containing sulfotransferase family protein [Oceanicola sp. 502str15]MCO6384520.1 tetratricopeptide repeat protein [Oceanicola sp. 502str15]